jgi:hypothetical protein
MEMLLSNTQDPLSNDVKTLVNVSTCLRCKKHAVRLTIVDAGAPTDSDLRGADGGAI